MLRTKPIVNALAAGNSFKQDNPNGRAESVDMPNSEALRSATNVAFQRSKVAGHPMRDSGCICRFRSPLACFAQQGVRGYIEVAPLAIRDPKSQKKVSRPRRLKSALSTK